MDPALITVIITAAATLIAAIIAGVFALRTNARSRQNEHQLGVLKVLLEAAYKEYEFRTKQDIEEAKNNNLPPRIKSFTEYVIFYREMAGIFSKPEVSSTDIINSLRKNKELIDTYYSNREEQRPEYHKAADRTEAVSV